MPAPRPKPRSPACSCLLYTSDVGYFFYIGGNDSMDTIGKLADYGTRIDSDIRFMGVPKTCLLYTSLVSIIRERVETNKRKKGIYEITNH